MHTHLVFRQCVKCTRMQQREFPRWRHALTKDNMVYTCHRGQLIGKKRRKRERERKEEWTMYRPMNTKTWYVALKSRGLQLKRRKAVGMKYTLQPAITCTHRRGFHHLHNSCMLMIDGCHLCLHCAQHKILSTTWGNLEARGGSHWHAVRFREKPME